MGIIGLIFIIAAWYLQLRSPQKLQKIFIILYALGTLMLVVYSISYESLFMAILYFVVFALSVWLFLKTNQSSKRR